MAKVGPERYPDVFMRRDPTADGGRYRHWDTLRHVEPPDGLTSEEWWLGTKLARLAMSHDLPLRIVDGTPCTYCTPDPVLEMLHVVDQRASGSIVMSEAVTGPETRDRYIVNSLIEEAITSSQLEGASTTHRVAKEMLRTGRSPRDRGERMILGNFRAMEFVRETRGEDLTPALVLEIHRRVAQGTLDSGDVGRLQAPGEERVRVVWDDVVLHEPPPAEELPDRLAALCAFANGQDVEGFLHPVARAILVHFWLAYDHPFADGNGRTARALFYWSMLRQGYWLAEYLSISRILRAAPARYARSFLYCETDGGDLTYFLLSQLKVLCRSIEELHAYLEHTMREAREVERLLARSSGYNHRQVALLGHALRHPDAEYTFQSHARSHNVVYQSARTDLLDLETKGLLERRQVGKTYYFSPAPDLAERMRGRHATASPR